MALCRLCHLQINNTWGQTGEVALVKKLANNPQFYLDMYKNSMTINIIHSSNILKIKNPSH
jgi:hypothetical protein